MRFGVTLPQYGASCDPARVAEYARSVEEMGYDSLWVGDRLLTPTDPSDLYPVDPKPYPPEFTTAADPFVVWAAAAAATQRVTLGSSTLNATWYNPAQLARSLTTIDALSRGRLLVGIGTSWMRDEYRVSGVEWETRGALLDELVDFLQVWWTANPVSFSGRFIEVPESVVDLRPARPGGPPLYFAGFGPAAMRRIGRVGDGWLALDGTPPDYAGYLWSLARTAAEQAGRDPGALQRVIRVNPYPDLTVEQVVAHLADLEAAGYDEAFVDLSYTTSTVDGAIERAAALWKSWANR